MTDTKNEVIEHPKMTENPLFYERTIMSHFRLFDPQKDIKCVCELPILCVCIDICVCNISV